MLLPCHTCQSCGCGVLHCTPFYLTLRTNATVHCGAGAPTCSQSTRRSITLSRQQEVAIPVRRAIPITRLPQPEGSGGAAQLLRTVASNASEAASAQSSEAAADAVPLPLFSASSVGPGAAVPEPTPATPLHPATSTPVRLPVLKTTAFLVLRLVLPAPTSRTHYKK